MQNHQTTRNTSETPNNAHQSAHSTDAFTGRDSACPRRKKAPTGLGEGFGKATTLVESEARVCPADSHKAINIAANVARELRFPLTLCVIVYCIVEVLP